MKFQKNIITLIFIITSIFILSACNFYPDTNKNNIVDKKVSKEDFLPKENIVAFYLEPSNISEFKKGEEISVSLMLNTNEETITAFDSVFNYYKRRLNLKAVKINPDLKRNMDLDDTKEGYVTMNASGLDSGLTGEIKVAELIFTADEPGRAFFDIVKGSLSAINLNGDNVADVESLKKVDFQIVE